MLKRKCAALFFAAVLFFAMAAPASAYFNRGTVSLSLGQSAVTVNKGEFATVSVTIFPIKELQLPGCGMAECPQTCGGTGCLNENGECTCGGTEYQTYYSTVSAVSSNTAVANVSYANGVLTVTGESAGSATITVTGSMRQYTDAEAALSVTVEEPKAQNAGTQNGGNTVKNNTPQTSSNTDSAASSGNSSGTVSSGDGVSIAPVESGTAAQGSGAIGMGDAVTAPASAENAAEGTAGTAAAADGSTVIETARGVYEIVPLSPATDVQAFLQSARDNSRFVTFQKKEGENVEYSWTFDGKKLEDVKPVNLLGETTEEIPDDLHSLAGKEGGLLLNFEENTLPGEADLYVGVSPAFPDGAVLTARKMDENGKREVVAEDIVVENGYATFSTDQIGRIVLSEKSANNNLLILGIFACFLAAAAAGGAFILKGGKPKTAEENGAPAGAERIETATPAAEAGPDGSSPEAAE